MTVQLSLLDRQAPPVRDNRRPWLGAPTPSQFDRLKELQRLMMLAFDLEEKGILTDLKTVYKRYSRLCTHLGAETAEATAAPQIDAIIERVARQLNRVIENIIF